MLHSTIIGNGKGNKRMKNEGKEGGRETPSGIEQDGVSQVPRPAPSPSKYEISIGISTPLSLF